MNAVPDLRTLPNSADRSAPGRRFLFLQGLASPFFARLGMALATRGHSVRKLAFNAGDAMFWPGAMVEDYAGSPGDWPARLAGLLRAWSISDLVLFGDGRPLHAAAIAVGRAQGVAVWVFEEGYLRPGTIALEKGGVNASSPLPREPEVLRAMARDLPPVPREEGPGEPFPRRAGLDILYNLRVLAGQRRFPHWRSYRGWHVLHEYLGWARRGVLKPLRERISARREAMILGACERHPYFLFPLQLEGDFQVRRHSDLATVRHGVDIVVASFARGAAPEARLVIKGHPLDNGLVPWARIVPRIARAHGVADRVIYLDEVAYGPLLADCRGVITINSTAGLQALREGKPVALLGRALYGLPGLVWQGELDAYWRSPTPPDAGLVDALRRVLMAKALIPGGFFAEASIARAVEAACERMG